MMRALLVLVLGFYAASSSALPLPIHRLHVTLNPEQHSLEAEDNISMPRGAPKTFYFSIRQNLVPTSVDSEIKPAPGKSSDQPWMRRYSVTLREGHNSFTVRYAGEIYQSPEQEARESRNFATTTGIISDDGVVLDGESGWYPQIELEGSEGMLTFAMEVDMPKYWNAVSQGGRALPRSTRGWGERQPQREIFLVAGPFSEYTERTISKAQVYLRDKDESLARRYLYAAMNYIKLYEKMIGPYPYEKFALVENFWETGYSMPSFSLMGSQVLRLPFIIDSSYPHEILHNWWGNGVFVDYEKGNWSEGLTAYLADHLMQEQKSAGTEYRRAALQRYTDFVSASKEFPLAQFTSRYSASSEAVGYGKAMMMFHMLRKEMGEDRFILALQNLYTNQKFKVTGFSEVEQAFSQATGKNLKPFFEQWVQRAGAPQLRLIATQGVRDGEGFDLLVELEQTQSGSAYTLNVPIAVTLAGEENAFSTQITMTDKKGVFHIPLLAKPLRVDVDPEFDLFRRVDNTETPPALSRVLGADKLTLVLPRRADEPLRKAYQVAAQSWMQPMVHSIQVVWDDEIEQLPSEGAVWLFGWENRFRDEFEDALSAAAQLSSAGAELGGSQFAVTANAMIMAAQGKKTPLALLNVPEPEMLPALVRKLPHYARFSYAVFDKKQATTPDMVSRGWRNIKVPKENMTTELNNVANGLWPVTGSPLAQPVPDAEGNVTNVARGKLARRYPLVTQ